MSLWKLATFSGFLVYCNFVLVRFHIAGMGMTCALWYAGGAFALPLGPVFPPAPAVLLANIEYSKLTKTCMVPLFLEQLMPLLQQDDNRGFRALARFQCVMVTGAACSPRICKELVENGVKLLISYGSTGKPIIQAFSKMTATDNTPVRNIWQVTSSQLNIYTFQRFIRSPGNSAQG